MGSSARPSPGREDQEPGGACCASTYAQARLPEARTTETRRYAATSYLSALWISSGVRANTVPAIVSEGRPVNRTIEWCFFPLTGQAPAEGGELNRLELQRPVREEELLLVHVVLSPSRPVYSP